MDEGSNRARLANGTGCPGCCSATTAAEEADSDEAEAAGGPHGGCGRRQGLNNTNTNTLSPVNGGEADASS